MCSAIGLPREPIPGRLITLLNTELKILARVLANHLQIVISDLIGPEQNYTVKGISIQDNLHLVHEG